MKFFLIPILALLPALALAKEPRIEARTELFELVGTLAGGELSLLIDRYESNEPLLHAQVEIESGGLKAKATFHADHWDYAVADAALIKLLATPGEHPLVVTVIAGKESDLIDGTLHTSAEQAEAAVHSHEGHGHGWRPSLSLIVGAALALFALAAFVLRKKFRGARA